MQLIESIKSLNISELSLHIEGAGDCEWRESRQVRKPNGYHRTEYTYYKGFNKYLNTIIDLIPNETGIVLKIFYCSC